MAMFRKGVDATLLAFLHHAIAAVAFYLSLVCLELIYIFYQ